MVSYEISWLPYDTGIPIEELVPTLARLRNAVVGNRRRKAACQREAIIACLCDTASRVRPGLTPAENEGVAIAIDVLGLLALPSSVSINLYRQLNVEQVMLEAIRACLAPSTSASAGSQATLLECSLRSLRAVYTERYVEGSGSGRVPDTQGLFEPPASVDRTHPLMDVDGDASSRKMQPSDATQDSSVIDWDESWDIIFLIIEFMSRCTSQDDVGYTLGEQRALLTQACDLFLIAFSSPESNLVTRLVLADTRHAMMLLRIVVRIAVEQDGKLLLSALRLFQAFSHFRMFDELLKKTFPIGPSKALRDFFYRAMSLMHSSNAELCLVSATTIDALYDHLPLDFSTSATTAVAVLLRIIEKQPDLRIEAAAAFGKLIYILLSHDLTHYRSAQLAVKSETVQEVASKNRCFEVMRVALAPTASNLPYPTEATIKAEALLKQNIFIALASFCVNNQSWRGLVIASNLLPEIVRGLRHDDAGVRAAACLCVRGLSRSVNILRTSLLESGAAEAICRLLRPEECWQVQVTACATISNLLLEFSPMRNVLLELGCMKELCRLAKSDDFGLRRTALWAVKNAVYQSKRELKEQTMNDLGWDFFRLLIEDDHEATSEQALGILRNIVATNNGEDPIGVAEIGEERMFGVLKRRLQSKSTRILLHALYTLVNLASTDDSTKLTIVQRDTIMREVVNSLAHHEAEVRSAAVWVIINLAYQEGKASYRRKQAEVVSILRGHGIDVKLKRMVADESLDVRERVQDALKALAEGAVF